MIKGIYRLTIKNANGSVIEKVQENLILDNGLKVLLGSHPPNSTPFLSIGSDDLDVKTDQTTVQVLLGNKSSSEINPLQVSWTYGPDDDEYIKITYAFQAKESEFNGHWAELSVPNFSRIVLKESGTLNIGTEHYGITSHNSTGESVMVTLDIPITTSGSTVRFDFEAAPNQTVNTRVPSEYFLYKMISGTYLKVATTSAFTSERFYFYDRGEFLPLSGTFNPNNSLLQPPANFIGFPTTDPTPKGIDKTPLMKVNVRVDIYVGNRDVLLP
jgi:hypothetical protein